MRKLISNIINRAVIRYIYPYFKITNDHMDGLYDSIVNDKYEETNNRLDKVENGSKNIYSTLKY